MLAEMELGKDGLFFPLRCSCFPVPVLSCFVQCEHGRNVTGHGCQKRFSLLCLLHGTPFLTFLGKVQAVKQSRKTVLEVQGQQLCAGGKGEAPAELLSHWRLRVGWLMLQRANGGCLIVFLRQSLLVPALPPPVGTSTHLGMTGLFLSALQEQLLKGALVCSNCPDSQANPCQSAHVFSFQRAILRPESQALAA